MAIGFFCLQVTLMLPTKFLESIRLSIQEKKWKIDFRDGGHLGYPIRMVLAIFIYLSVRCFLSSFKTIGLLFQEKKRKIDFQDGGHGEHLGLRIRTILAIFYLQVTLMLPTKFRVNWRFGSGEEVKNRFARYLGFPIGTILANFDLQVTLMLPTKFQAFWFRRRNEK